MRNKLSELIENVKVPENYLPKEEVKILFKTTLQSPNSNAKDFRPSRVLNKFKPLKAIIMISIIGLIIIAISQFGFNTDTNTPPQRIATSSNNEQSVVASDTLQVSLDSINQIVGDQKESLEGILNDNKLSEPSSSQLIVGNDIDRQSKDNLPAVQSEVDSNSVKKHTPPELFEIDKPILEPVLISNEVLDCFGIDSTIRSYEFMATIGVWGSNIFEMEEPHTIAFTGVFSWKELRITFDSLPEHIICGGTEEVYIDQYLESCIPFQSETVGKSGDFQVYWIFPSDKLLDCLPDYISEPMRLELIKTFNQTWGGSPVAISPPQEKESDGVSVATINEEVKSAPCNFIPSFCEGVSGLDNLSAYPCPVTDQLNIDVILSRSKTIQYRVFDISGRVLNDELPIRNYSEAGRYTEQINLHDLKSGIYILVLTDNEGARMTKRIMKN